MTEQQRQFENIERVCKDCKTSFVVEAGEQRWLHEKFGEEFNVPVRCRPCRKLRKEQGRS